MNENMTKRIACWKCGEPMLVTASHMLWGKLAICNSCKEKMGYIEKDEITSYKQGKTWVKTRMGE